MDSRFNHLKNAIFNKPFRKILRLGSRRLEKNNLDILHLIFTASFHDIQSRNPRNRSTIAVVSLNHIVEIYSKPECESEQLIVSSLPKGKKTDRYGRSDEIF